MSFLLEKPHNFELIFHGQQQQLDQNHVQNNDASELCASIIVHTDFTIWTFMYGQHIAPWQFIKQKNPA